MTSSTPNWNNDSAKPKPSQAPAEKAADTDVAPARSGLIGRARSGVSYLKANRKRLFWLWIGYQAIKGTITLSLIWIPLFLFWLRSRGEA